MAMLNNQRVLYDSGCQLLEIAIYSGFKGKIPPTSDLWFWILGKF